MKGIIFRGCFFFFAIFFFCTGLEYIPGAWAQTVFPNKPITIDITFPPGGSTDLIFRALGKAAEPYLGQPVVIANTAGGMGTVALVHLMKKEADGYSLAVVTTGAVSAQYMWDVPFNLLKDFSPVTDVIAYYAGLVVRSDSPWKTLSDFITYTRQNPGKITYSTSGPGSANHLVIERLAAIEKIKLTHVAYSGAVEAVTALLGGHVTASSGTTDWKPYVDEGRLRLLAIYGDTRMPHYPNVPTLKDLGYNFSMSPFLGLIGPKGIPLERANILSSAFKKAMEDPKFKQVRDSFIMSSDYKDPREFTKHLEEMDSVVKTILANLGLMKK